MQQVIYLKPDIAKCLPVAFKCEQEAGCACRWVAHSPGRPLTDHTNGYMWLPGKCLSFVAIADAKPAAPKPRVHEAMKGLT